MVPVRFVPEKCSAKKLEHDGSSSKKNLNARKATMLKRQVYLILVGVAVLSSAVLTGCFLDFSDFMMRSLAEAGEPCGSRVMKQVNVDVIGSVFIAQFIGMAPLSIALPIIGNALRLKRGPLLWLSFAAVCYCGGCFLVTGAGNVPMNNKLASFHVPTLYWRQEYLPRWTALNTWRTAACLVTSAAYLVAFTLLADLSSAYHPTTPLLHTPPDASLLIDVPSSSD